MTLQDTTALNGEVIPPGGEDVRVVAAHHPFKVERTDQQMVAGLTLAEMLERAQPDPVLRRHARIMVGDWEVPRENWHLVRPKPGATVTIRVVPHGGGGGGDKNPLRTVLTIAVIAASVAVSAGALAPVLGGAAGLSFAAGSVSAAVAAGVVSVAGSLLVNALIPPSQPQIDSLSGSDGRDSATLSISGSRNRANLFGMVPRPYGTHRMVPPYGAQPFTEVQGDNQYLRLLFVWGYGPLDISDIKIGETPLSDFDEVDIETRQGYQGDSDLTLYSRDVAEQQLSIRLEQTSGFVSRTTEPDTDEIILDLTFPRGLVEFNDRGNKRTRSVEFEIEYAPAGSGSWTQLTRTTVSGRQTNALRRGFREKVTRGQYDVRVRRITGDTNSSSIFDVLSWTALRSVKNEDPIQFDQPLAKTAIRIRATDQLNGVVDELNGVVTSILPDWDGSAWTEKATNNPAAIYRDVLTGNANARALPTSRLDDTTLQEWHEFCEAEGFAYNFPGDSQSSVQRKLADIAQAGRAAPTIRDGKWSVVIDQERTTPVQHFTPRNSWGFEGQKAFPEQPHAWRVRFPNENEGYEQDERIVYDDGFDASNATKFEGLELAGVTSPEQAYKLGRYHIATARLRPEVYTFQADVEHIVCTRGDLIRVTHDVTLWGLNSGRVKAVQDDGGSPAQATGVTLDETVTMEAGKTYNVRFRLADGSTLIKDVDTVAGDTDTLTFATPFDLDDAPEAGDLFMFGETDTESVELVVKAIEPQGDLTAKITAVDHSPAIYRADQGTIPEFDTGITPIPALPAVNVVEIRSDESALQRTPTGLLPRVIITVQPTQVDGAFLEARIRPDNADEGYQPASIQTQGDNQLVLTDVDEGESYDIELRWRTNSDARTLQGTGLGPWTAINGYRVVGRTTPPSGLQNLTISALGGMAFLRWDPVPDIDVKFGGRIEIRHTPKLTGVSWATSTSISRAAQGNATQVQVPLKAGTYLLRPFDSAGIPSETVATVTTKQAQAIDFANVSSVTEQTAFSGTKTDVVVDSGSLKLAAGSDIDSVAEIDAVASIDSLGGITPDGTYEFAGSIDTGVVANYRGTGTIEAVAINERDLLSERTDPIDSWQSIDGTDAAVSDAWIEVRHTDDDPTGTPTWSAWERLDAAEFNARAFEFRAQLRTDDPSYNIRVDRLEASIDEVNYT